MPADAISPPRILRVRRLCKQYGHARGGALAAALDDVSFDVRRGETLGIVGESGSGKTTCARCILRAVDPTSGSVQLLDGPTPIELTTLPQRKLKPLRRRLQMIFQDPFSSLNPRMTVGDILAEPLIIHRIGNRSERADRVAAMLRRVGLPADAAGRYPHAFSGGQRQRVGIGRALILRPTIVVADEAVSALDVSVRARILELLAELRCELNLTLLFVSHDLGVIKQICDSVIVMHRGRIVESGPARQTFEHPRHAYTQVLLSAIPLPDPDRKMASRRVEDLTPDQLLPLADVNAGLVD